MCIIYMETRGDVCYMDPLFGVETEGCGENGKVQGERGVGRWEGGGVGRPLHNSNFVALLEA